MTDPLLTLRTSIKSSTPITYTDVSGAPTASLTVASHIVLAPGRSFPKSTPTRFRSSATEQKFWRLDAIYVAWLLRTAPAAEYMRQAREHGLAVGFVSVMERKGVVDWLEGRIDSHERIVPLEGMTQELPLPMCCDLTSLCPLQVNPQHLLVLPRPQKLVLVLLHPRRSQ
jgi:parafibromin